MGMVADSRGPRPCTLHARSFVIAVTVVHLAAIAAAQDRVVLFDRPSSSSTPFDVREFEVADAGRRWSLLRTTTLPPHSAGRPVALADGSRLLWIAYFNDAAMLIQYEFATGRAAIVDVGRFAIPATLVADPYALRVIIVEPQRVTFVDQRLQPYSVALSSVVTDAAAIAVSDGYVVVQRRLTSDAEAVVINAQTAEIVRTLPLAAVGVLRATRDAQRFYHASGPVIEMRSLTTGQLLARTTTSASGVQLFELDEARGLLIHSATAEDNRKQIVGRDATSLSLIGELGFGLLNSRMQFQLKQTRNEGAILVFSTNIPTTGVDTCEDSSPRIDVFDGRTLALATRIELQRRCATILAVPPR